MEEANVQLQDSANGSGDVASNYPRYKTSMCFFHKKGRCMNGDNCRFAHGLSELKRHQSKFLKTIATKASATSSTLSVPPPPPPDFIPRPPTSPPPPPSSSASSSEAPLLLAPAGYVVPIKSKSPPSNPIPSLLQGQSSTSSPPINMQKYITGLVVGTSGFQQSGVGGRCATLRHPLVASTDANNSIFPGSLGMATLSALAAAEAGTSLNQVVTAGLSSCSAAAGGGGEAGGGCSSDGKSVVVLDGTSLVTFPVQLYCWPNDATTNTGLLSSLPYGQQQNNTLDGCIGSTSSSMMTVPLAQSQHVGGHYNTNGPAIREQLFEPILKRCEEYDKMVDVSNKTCDLSTSTTNCHHNGPLIVNLRSNGDDGLCCTDPATSRTELASPELAQSLLSPLQGRNSESSNYFLVPPHVQMMHAFSETGVSAVTCGGDGETCVDALSSPDGMVVYRSPVLIQQQEYLCDLESPRGGGYYGVQPASQMLEREATVGEESAFEQVETSSSARTLTKWLEGEEEEGGYDSGDEWYHATTEEEQAEEDGQTHSMRKAYLRCGISDKAGIEEMIGEEQMMGSSSCVDVLVPSQDQTSNRQGAERSVVRGTLLSLIRDKVEETAPYRTGYYPTIPLSHRAVAEQKATDFNYHAALVCLNQASTTEDLNRLVCSSNASPWSDEFD
eukprot:GHVS01011681.1.p1 GENE.GHVS01011681.1~~GHVS01011681.1.p1  ORF type:complete len:670 (-),score=110.17 GHVS01011681.1:479-2488(-)